MSSPPEALVWALPALIGTQRVLELLRSRRNLKRTSALPSAKAGSARAFTAMVLVHAGLVALPPLEALAFERTPSPWVAWGALFLFGLASCLRFWAMRSLGQAWNARARVTPGLGFRSNGPYRWIRHPNYLAVLIDFASVPLVLGAWWSWLLLNVLHAPILAYRVRAEERLLARIPGYADAMHTKGRFFPRCLTPGRSA